MQWYRQVPHSSGLAKTILQGTVEGGRRQNRQKKRWEDNIREWTGLEFVKSQRAVKSREKWRKLSAKLSVVPQRPSRLRYKVKVKVIPLAPDPPIRTHIYIRNINNNNNKEQRETCINLLILKYEKDSPFTLSFPQSYCSLYVTFLRAQNDLNFASSSLPILHPFSRINTAEDKTKTFANKRVNLHKCHYTSHAACC